MTSEAIALARTLICRFEGCSFAPYADSAGNWTIGWGFRHGVGGKPVTSDTPCLTQAQADALLTDYLAPLAAEVDAMLPAGATDNEAAALLDFAWNLGASALRRSTLLRRFRDGNRAGAAEQFAAWVYAGGVKLPGLVARRKAERALFEGRFAIGKSGEEITKNPQSSAVFGTDSPREEITPSDALNAAELVRINKGKS